MGFVVMVVLETGCIRMSQKEWQEGISVIDSIQFFANHEVGQIMLNDWTLCNSSSLSSSSVDSNAISESKDVLESLVLKSIRIDVNNSLMVSNTTLQESRLGLAWRVNDSRKEVFLNDSTCINAFEDSDFLSNLVLLHFNHFPTKVDINASLVALFQCDFIGIGELEDFLVWSPELDSSILC